MSIFATLYATEPTDPREALRMAFPVATIIEDDLFRVTTSYMNASSKTPSHPNFHEELIGFDPAILIYFILDKADTFMARQDLSAAVRSFLGSSHGDVVVCYFDFPILKRDAQGSYYKTSYEDFANEGEWMGVDRIDIPRDKDE
jgi:hypothetical protein